MLITKRLAAVSLFGGMALFVLTAAPRPAQAWWRGGVVFGVMPPAVVVPPPVYIPPPVFYPPPPVYAAPPLAYYPRPRPWIPGHWRHGYWIPGHWG